MKRTKADLVQTLRGCEQYFKDYDHIPEDLELIRILIEDHIMSEEIRKAQYEETCND